MLKFCQAFEWFMFNSYLVICCYNKTLKVATLRDKLSLTSTSSDSLTAGTT